MQNLLPAECPELIESEPIRFLESESRNRRSELTVERPEGSSLRVERPAVIPTVSEQAELRPAEELAESKTIGKLLEKGVIYSIES